MFLLYILLGKNNGYGVLYQRLEYLQNEYGCPDIKCLSIITIFHKFFQKIIFLIQYKPVYLYFFILQICYYN